MIPACDPTHLPVTHGSRPGSTSCRTGSPRLWVNQPGVAGAPGSDPRNGTANRPATDLHFALHTKSYNSKHLSRVCLVNPLRVPTGVPRCRHAEMADPLVGDCLPLHRPSLLLGNRHILGHSDIVRQQWLGGSEWSRWGWATAVGLPPMSRARPHVSSQQQLAARPSYLHASERQH